MPTADKSASDAERFGIQVGQIYIAADGSKAGHLVTDIASYADCGDVITTPFTGSGWGQPGNRIDAFKLAVVRYNLVDVAPEWMPESVKPESLRPKTMSQK